MSYRKFTFSLGEYYHIYSRGVEKRPIFLSSDDYRRFQKLLFLCNSSNKVVFRDCRSKRNGEIDRGEALASVGAYCLMPNHFHVLVREVREGGITEFMRKLLTAYSMYFNKTNERPGTLFDRAFKAEHVAKDEYLKYLYSYIHLNPIKLIDPEWKDRGITNLVAAKEYLQGYKSSSYMDYQGMKRDESLILHRDAFPDYFQTPSSFDDFIEEWLSFKKESGAESPVAGNLPL